MVKCIGIDVGGANIKYADSRGEFGMIYLPIWKNLDMLEEKLEEIGRKTKPDVVGVVLTAELSDVFKSKAEGVRFIEKAVKRVFENTYFMNLDGELKREIDTPEKFFANNWIASVRFLLKDHSDFIFVDMGSTTTDIIPVKDCRILASKTDFERLKRRELLYFGLLRTPAFFLLKDNCSSEFFSITADAMLIDGIIREEDYICETPDGRGKSLEECMQRLARQYCSDLSEVGAEFVRKKAGEIKQEMVERISEVLREKGERYDLKTVIGCGIGEKIIEESAALSGFEYISAEKIYGKVSYTFPAYAISRLVEMHDSCQAWRKCC